MSAALGLGGPQSPALRRQAPWEGPLGGRGRVRVSPQEAGRPDPQVVRRAQFQAEVRELVRGSVGPSVLAQGAFECFRGLIGPCLFSRLERPAGLLAARVAAGRQGESGAGARGPQSPALWRQDPWDGPSGAVLELGLAPGGRRAHSPVVWRAEGKAEVRALARGSVGPSVLPRGALECRWRLGEPCAFSRPE